MTDLFRPAADTFSSPACPLLELGAYEALWMSERPSFASLARLFGRRPGVRPSELVPRAESERLGRLALAVARRSGAGPFELLLSGMPAYPAKLRDAAHPVEVLYSQGRPELLGRRCVAIVGTRRPSLDGARLAGQWAGHFARAGSTVLSGLAEGVDTCAHRGAIESGGVTAAVLGTPLTAVHPPANAPLQRRLAREFLVVSQVPIVRYARQDAAHNRRFFRDRDATLAALADTVVIVEAGDRSGALICARHALELRRPLFIPEHCCRHAGLAWPTRLLRRGAVRMRTIEDVDALLGA